MAPVLYRKYRPKTLAQVIGQKETTHLLHNAAARDRFAHAYLFYGPRGTGKTTTARLLAKLLNCEKRNREEKFRKDGEPCNACQLCRDIDAGISFDVIEIDAASNRGIDEMRNLKESVRAVPTAARFRVYIIDEAHMLTGAAFNALLKTLEEPPPHGVIILATTEYEKLPATVTSRTQRFLFKKPSKKDIFEKLKGIAKEENIQVTEDALELIAAAAEGSFRDAESLLDQLGSLAGAVDAATVEHVTGRVSVKRVETLAKLILERNLEQALECVERAHEEGHNIAELVKGTLHYLRKVIALSLHPALADSFEREATHDELERMRSLAGLVDPPRALPLLQALLTAYSEMRYSPVAIVPLEIALIEQLKQ
jgi:DNA polymerase-3 subunit gamma/tau